MKETRDNNRQVVRELGPGEWAYFPDGMGRYGYRVSTPDVARRLHARLRMINAAAALIAGCLGAVPVLVLLRGDDEWDLDVVSAVVAGAAVVVLLGMDLGHRFVLNGLVRVTDSRPLWVRFLSFHMASAASRVSFAASVGLMLAGCAILATLPFQWFSALVVIAVAAVPAAVVASWLLDRLRR